LESVTGWICSALAAAFTLGVVRSAWRTAESVGGTAKLRLEIFEAIFLVPIHCTSK
jgi:hypothetical protein